MTVRQKNKAFSRYAALAALGMGALSVHGCGAPEAPEASDAPTEEQVGEQDQALLGAFPIKSTPSVFDWSMQPRAFSSRFNHTVVNGRETYSGYTGPYGSYAHPTSFIVNFHAKTIEVGAELQWQITRSDISFNQTSPWSSSPDFIATVKGQGTYNVTLLKRVGTTVTTLESSTIDVRDIVIAIVGDSMSSGEGDPDKYVVNGSAPQWMDLQCHRSLHSGSARAALQFEKDHPHLSVTLLDYACSGAKTAQLHADTQGGRIPQLESLKQDLANGDGTYREVADMFMTIGINNLYFSSLISDCLSPFKGSCDMEYGQVTRDHLKQLDTDYDALGVAIKRMPYIKKTHLVEYPATAIFQNDKGELDACGLLDQWGYPPDIPVPLPTDLSIDERQFLFDTGKTLVATGAQNADANGWDYIGGVDAAFKHRGYCSADSQRYFNTQNDTYANQGDSQGIFHPNAAGYTVMAGLIDDVLEAEQRIFFPTFPLHRVWLNDFADAGGWNEPAYANTIQFPDVNGDGRHDVCGRASTGVLCALSTGSSSFAPPTLWNNTFSDANGFDQAKFYETMKFPDINHDGKADICIRDARGILCAKSNGTSFAAPTRATLSFGDGDGFGDPRYYSSIDFPDFNRDGKADVCGRGPNGILCGPGYGDDGGMFYPVSLMVPWEFTDAKGFGNGPEYYDTIRYPDVNGDQRADICGRSPTGIVCAMSRGDKFDIGASSTFFSDANGFSLAPYYLSIGYADVTGDGLADVCGRTSGGVYCAKSNGGHPFDDAILWSSAYDSYTGWSSAAEFYDTIQYPDLDDDGMADVCGRGYSGMYCALSTGAAFRGASTWDGAFSDANGWGVPTTYKTLTFSDVDHDQRVELCGRGKTGIFCWDIQ